MFKSHKRTQKISLLPQCSYLQKNVRDNILLYKYMLNGCHTNKNNIYANNADSHNTLFNLNNIIKNNEDSYN